MKISSIRVAPGKEGAQLGGEVRSAGCGCSGAGTLLSLAGRVRTGKGLTHSESDAPTTLKDSRLSDRDF